MTTRTIEVVELERMAALTCCDNCINLEIMLQWAREQRDAETARAEQLQVETLAAQNREHKWRDRFYVACGMLAISFLILHSVWKG